MHHPCLEFFSAPNTWWIISIELILEIPALAFLGFLFYTARESIRKLTQSNCPILTTYYAMLWFVSGFNLIRASIDLSPEKGGSALRTGVWLWTVGGLFFLEVSVVLLLAQGYLISGRKAMLQTGLTAGIITILLLIYKGMFLWLGWIEVYGVSESNYMKQTQVAKFFFWCLKPLVCLVVYSVILALPHTRWREVLPARPSFQRYIGFLVGLNFFTLLGASLLTADVTQGYCVYGVCAWVYFSLYPPALYLTFLFDFFQNEEMLALDEAYYSEMKDAGYFEEDDEV
eukprot:CAMPEP_0196586572 /NCGR_PEP_ID=MMETSP1081-20130531/54828_1 /TAXON_ID=36882 /ORGANISM="Pyramimonas amylifera, Strain CCMP720" /LENGTH=285 /DNA_ID=CAMNT_0041908499 /DNA_START=65 /DNA_END=922 /DNA_ORIENTATION=-